MTGQTGCSSQNQLSALQFCWLLTDFLAYYPRGRPRGGLPTRMLALKNVAAKPVPLLVEPPAGNAEERKQQRMMVIALVLLLISLGVVLFRDRDFWFPDTEQAEDQPEPTAHAAVASASPGTVPQAPATTHRKESSAKAQPTHST